MTLGARGRDPPVKGALLKRSSGREGTEAGVAGVRAPCADSWLGRSCAVRRAPGSGVREHPFRRGDSFGRPAASQTPDPASRDARYRRILPNGRRATRARRAAPVDEPLPATPCGPRHPPGWRGPPTSTGIGSRTRTAPQERQGCASLPASVASTREGAGVRGGGVRSLAPAAAALAKRVSPQSRACPRPNAARGTQND